MALGMPRWAALRRRKAPKGALGAVQGLGGDAQGGGGAVGGGRGAAAEPPAAADGVVGGEAEPGAEVLGAGPAGHVEADLAEHLQDGVGLQAVDGGEVDAGYPVQLGGGVEAEVVAIGAGRRAGGGGPRAPGRGTRGGGLGWGGPGGAPVPAR